MGGSGAARMTAQPETRSTGWYVGRFPDGQFPNGRLVRHLGVLFEVPLVAQGQIEHRVHSVCGAVFTAVDDVGALCPQCAAIERRMGDTDGGR